MSCLLTRCRNPTLRAATFMPYESFKCILLGTGNGILGPSMFKRDEQLVETIGFFSEHRTLSKLCQPFETK